MVILDSGHGYDTYGKASPVWPDGTQLFEWEFNRDIVTRIHKEFTRIGIDSVILVHEALDISLKVRCDRANKIYSDYPDSFLISVHGNAGERPNEGTGWEAWTSPGQTESDNIAAYLYDAAKIVLPEFRLRTDYSDGDTDKESKFYILIKTECPAVLTENLFFDNQRDCNYMLSDEGRDSIARLHVMGIVRYFIYGRNVKQ